MTHSNFRRPDASKRSDIEQLFASRGHCDGFPAFYRSLSQGGPRGIEDLVCAHQLYLYLVDLKNLK